MSKEEFLKQLQEALRGNVSPEVIRENLEFYETYILQELRKNKTEQEILQALGNPRILAQTIIDTTKMDGNDFYEEHTENKKDRQRSGSEDGWKVTGKNAKLRMWVILAVIILVILGILMVVGRIFALVAPFIIPIVLLVIVVRMIERRR